MRLEPTTPNQDAVLDEGTVVRYIHIVTTSHSWEMEVGSSLRMIDNNESMIII